MSVRLLGRKVGCNVLEAEITFLRANVGYTLSEE